MIGNIRQENPQIRREALKTRLEKSNKFNKNSISKSNNSEINADSKINENFEFFDFN